ncbi:Beige/BEACH domain containing protein [Trichomonas vaginalis G3]|uniref:Beige/BEACH domain containing protein n=1 Tax=Trichomonas vaginalis (strain ATCC PRA-98 / G3) TaxID=412133 RepID=A2EX80_TRIV3|nr:beige/BEACH-related family [Trichomonas vaginalis G3]EAY02739.1 Beige/BEACH domain containing protein [Trichomonas vaginalis G3]KAI5517240.1 beige/BEACH-related family [Trichomonas vaginalis G3]|eukprot:XP_001314962.1 Beige/BEACH domain containing protein [Trichomonas vaginalis G3]
MDDIDLYELFNFNDLIIRILSIQPIEDEKIEEMEEEFRTIFEDYEFPNLSPTDLRKIEKELSEGYVISDILSIYDIKLTFYPDVLDEITNSHYFKTNYPKYFIVFTLQNFVSWVSIYDRCHNPEYFTVLLKSLHTISTFKSVNSIYYAGNMAASAFLYSYEHLLRFPQDINYIDIVNPIEEYFLYHELLPSSAYQILGVLSEQIFKTCINLSNLPAQFLDFLTHLSKTVKERIPSSIYELVLHKNVLALSNLYIFSLKFFKESIRFVDKNLPYILFEPICSKIIAVLEKHIINNQETTKNTDHPIKLHKQAKLFHINSKRKPLQKTDIKYVEEKLLELKKNCDNMKLIDEDFRMKLDLLIETVSFDEEISNKFIKIYSDVLISEKKEKSLNQLLVFFYLADKISNSFHFPVDQILFQPLLAPETTIFGNMPLELNVTRYHACSTLLKCSQSSFKEILSPFTIFPLIFAELSLRFAVSFRNVDEEWSEDLSTWILEVFFSLSDYESIKQTHLEAVRYMRSSIFVYLMSILSFTNTRKIFFDSFDFCRSYFCLFYEKEIGKDFEKLFDTFLMETDDVSQDLVQSVDVFSEELFENKEYIILKQMLKTINKSMSNQKISKSFSKVTDNLCTNLTQISKDDKESVDILMEVVTFLSNTTKDLKINAKNLIAIESCIDKNVKINDEIRDKLIDILSGGIYSQNHQPFVIKQPSVLTLLVKVFKGGQKQHSLLKFLLDLLRAKPINVWRCHESGFDMTLLDLLFEWRVEGKVEEENVDLCLIIVNFIAMSITSPVVVQKYISLLSSFDGEHLPFYHSNFVKSLQRLFKTGEFMPDGSLCLDNLSTVSIQNCGLSNDFTFSFWLFFMKQNIGTKQILIQIKKDNESELRISLKNGVICIVLRSSEVTTKLNLDVDLQEYKWNFVSISFRSKQIKIYTNKSLSLTFNEFYGLSPTNYNIKINFPSQKYKNNPTKGLKLGSFCLLNGSFDLEYHNKLFTLGLRNNYKNDDVCFSFVPHLVTGRFKPSKFSSCGLKFVHNIKRIKRELTFPSLFVSVCNVENVVPLFAQIDMINLNNEKEKDLCHNAINVLKCVLTTSKSAQISFCDVDGFRAISHLLIETENCLNFEIYNGFYELSNMIKHKSLLKQLLEYIVLNLDIWIKCDEENHLKILKHYRDVLFVNTSLAKTILSFPFWSSILRCYYWYKDADKNFSVKTRNISPEKIVLFRQIIFEIMSFYINENLQENEYQVFLRSVISSQEDNQTFDLLGFIVSQMTSPKTCQKVTKMIFTNISCLLQLIARNKPELTSNTIQATSYMFSSKTEFHSFVFQILMKMDPSVCKEFVLQGLTGIIDGGNTEVLPIAIYIAINLSQSHLVNLFNNLSRNSNYYFSDLSIVYPILAAFKSDEQSDLQIFDFIVKVFKGKWLEVFVLISIIGGELNMMTYAQTIQNIYLQSLCIYLMKNEKSDEDLTTFEKLVFNFIFFRPTLIEGTYHLKNTALNEMYTDSPFLHQKMPAKELNKLNILKNPNKVHLLVQKLPPKQYFGIRINEDNEWADSQLCVGALNLLMQNKKNSFEKHLLLMIGFVAEIDGTLVNQYDLTQFNDVDGICFVLSKQIKLGIPVDYKIPSNEIVSNGFNFLENVTKETTFFETLSNQITTSLMTSLREIQNSVQEIKLPTFDVVSAFDDMRKEKLQNGEDAWISMWRSMTLERAPWNSSLPPQSRNIVKYKRDRTVCRGFVPYKTRRNFDFDDHKMASLFRDTGNFDIAKQTLQFSYESGALSLERSKSVVYLPTATKIKARKSVDPTSDVLGATRNALTIKCRLVTIECKTKCQLSVNSKRIVITKMKDDKEHEKRIVIDKRDIVKFLMRSWRHKIFSGFELFTSQSKNYFVLFDTPSKGVFMQIVRALKLPPSANLVQTVPYLSFFSTTDFTNKWVNGEISNFDYLIILNELSGRTFNSASMYPVFPWTIKDYDSEFLDLSDPSVYRDFSLPVGAFNRQRLEDCQKKMNELIEFGLSPHLYSSGYSNPLSVYLWLLRMEPFTTRHIKMQSGRFDNPARLFFSVKDAFRLCNNQMGDFRELTPEFFYDVDFLLNKNEFDLGENVNDVILPSWAKDVFDYIYLMRKSLESDYASEHLNEWIDLIFGVNQRGKNAENTQNIFKKELYDDIWDDSYSTSDESIRLDIETQLDQVGQIPPQLFKEPHPKRLPKKKFRFDYQRKISLNNQDLINSTFVNFSQTDINLVALTQNGLILRYILPIDNILANQQNDQILPSNTSNVTKNIVSRKRSQIICCSPEDGIVTLHDVFNAPETGQTIGHVHTEVSCADTDDGWVVLAGTDAALLIIRNATGSVVRTYRDTISCLSVSSNFDLAACVSRDSSLIYVSLSRAEVSRAVELPPKSNPLFISIGPSMGSVCVVYNKAVDGIFVNFLRVYTVNGDLARERRLSFEVTDLCVFATQRSGIDTFCLGSSDGNVYLCECLSSVNLIPIVKCSSKVVRIEYVDRENAIVATAENGSIYIVPYE